MDLIKRIIAATCTAVISISILSIPSSAMSFERSEDGTIFRFDSEKGNYVTIGGINEYKKVKANNREETLELEEEVKHNDYILVSSDYKDITDEEFTLLKNQGYWFGWRYLNEENEFRWSMDKVYVYKPSFEDMLSQLETQGYVDDYTNFEIECSTVVLSYDFWYSWEKQGKMSDEFNDNIPEWEEKAYMLIKSPINIEIILLNIDEKTFYRFYVSANTPFLVALPCATYFVEDINGYKIENFESTLPSKNTVVLNSERNGTEATAYEIDITRTVEAYNIPEIDISEEPDTSSKSNQNIQKEKTKVQSQKPAEKKKLNIGRIIIAAILILAASGFLILIYIRTKKNDNQY